MRAINNITRGVCQVGINAWKVASMPKALRDKFLFLWTGGYSGNDLKDSLGSSAVISVTGKDWTTRYIPQNTSATFSVPDNATFLSADGDNFWFDTLDVRQQKTHADLIASTTMRTFIKYADFEPYNIYAIGILKAGEIITDADKITLNKFFKLWAEYWGELMDSGYMKDNRGGSGSWQTFWTHQMLESYKAINSHVTLTTEQEELIIERLSEDYILTIFGKDGLNKDVCDFFLFFQTSNITTNLTTRTITKTGETLRWNYGNGNVYSQNNLPAQITDGVVSCTSIDGFSGITAFDISNNSFYGELMDLSYYMPNLVILNVLNNSFTGVFPIVNKNTMQNINIGNNDFYGAIPDLSSFTAGGYHLFSLYQNERLTGNLVSSGTGTNRNLTIDTYECTGITGIDFATVSDFIQTWRFSNCNIPSEDIDALMAQFNAYYATHALVFSSFSFKITGVLNGYLTGGLSNADYVAFAAKCAADGKKLTCEFNIHPGAFDKGKVAFTFDDVALSVHDIGIPLFTSKGIVGTVYPNTAFIDAMMSYGELGCGWEELSNFITAGWTVGSHGSQHVNFLGLTEAQMITNIENANTAFVNAGLATPTHFSYPYGGYNATSTALMPTYFDSARVVDPNYMVGESSDPFIYPVVTLDAMTMDDLPLIRKYIDHAETNKVGLLFLTHGLYATTPLNDNSISVELMTAIIDYVLTKDIDVVNVDGLTALLGS